jgi:hypothetical protein
MLEIVCYLAHDIENAVDYSIEISSANSKTQLPLTSINKRLKTASLSLDSIANFKTISARVIIQINQEMCQENTIHRLAWNPDLDSRYWVIIVLDIGKYSSRKNANLKYEEDWLYHLLDYFGLLFWKAQSDDEFFQQLKSIYWGNSERYLRRVDRCLTLSLLQEKVSSEEMNSWTGFKRWLMINHCFLQAQNSIALYYDFTTTDKDMLEVFAPLSFLAEARNDPSLPSLGEHILLPFVRELIQLNWTESIPWALFILDIFQDETTDPLIHNLFEAHTSSLLSYWDAWKLECPRRRCPLPFHYLPNIRAVVQRALPTIETIEQQNELIASIINPIISRESYLPALKEEGPDGFRREIKALFSVAATNSSLWDTIKSNGIFEVPHYPSGDTSLEDLFTTLILPTISLPWISMDDSLAHLEAFLFKLRENGAAERVRIVYRCLLHLSSLGEVADSAKGLEWMGSLHRVVTEFVAGDELTARIEVYLPEECPKVVKMESESLLDTIRNLDTGGLQALKGVLNRFVAIQATLRLASLLFGYWDRSFELSLSSVNIESVRSMFPFNSSTYGSCIPLLASPSVTALHQLFLDEFETYPEALLDHEGLFQLKQKNQETKTRVGNYADDLLHGRVTFAELIAAKTVSHALRACSGDPSFDENLNLVIERAQLEQQKWTHFQIQLLAVVDSFTPNNESLKESFLHEIKLTLTRQVCDWSSPMSDIEYIVQRMSYCHSLFFRWIRAEGSFPPQDQYESYLKSIETVLREVDLVIKKFVDGTLDLATTVCIFQQQIDSEPFGQHTIASISEKEVAALGDEKYRDLINLTLQAITVAPQLRDILYLSYSRVCKHPPQTTDSFVAFVDLFLGIDPRKVQLSTVWTNFSTLQRDYSMTLEPMDEVAKLCRQLFEEDCFLDLMKIDRDQLTPIKTLIQGDRIQRAFLDTYFLFHEAGGLCSTPSPENIQGICHALKSLQSRSSPLKQLVGNVATISQVYLPNETVSSLTDLNSIEIKSLFTEHTDVMESRIAALLQIFGRELENRMDSDRELFRQIQRSVSAIMHGIDFPLIFQLTPSTHHFDFDLSNPLSSLASMVVSRVSETYELTFLCYTCQARGHVYPITVIHKEIRQALEGLADVVKVLQIAGKLMDIPIPRFDRLIEDALELTRICQIGPAAPLLAKSMRQGITKLSKAVPHVTEQHLESYLQQQEFGSQPTGIVTLDHQNQVKILLGMVGDKDALQTGLTRVYKGQSFVLWLCPECANGTKRDDRELR